MEKQFEIYNENEELMFSTNDKDVATVNAVLNGWNVLDTKTGKILNGMTGEVITPVL